VLPLEREDLQIRRAYVTFGAFTVLRYATVIVYRSASLWTRVMTCCMKRVDRSAAVVWQDELLGRS